MNIKKCICGAEPTLWVDNYDPVNFGHLPTEYQIACPECHRKTNWSINRDTVIKEWEKMVALDDQML